MEIGPSLGAAPAETQVLPSGLVGLGAPGIWWPDAAVVRDVARCRRVAAREAGALVVGDRGRGVRRESFTASFLPRGA